MPTRLKKHRHAIPTASTLMKTQYVISHCLEIDNLRFDENADMNN
jgi:hypothetical protein